MYLLITKSDCLSCDAARKLFQSNNVKYREVNCTDDDLSIEDIEIMKTTPNGNLNVFIKNKFIKDRASISRIELKEMFDDFEEFGSLPIIIKYNFLNHIENYMIGFSNKILSSWIKNDSLVGQYLDLNYAFKTKDCCYMCDKKNLINRIDLSSTVKENDSVSRLETLKEENSNFFEKYTQNKNTLNNEEEFKNDNEDELIMAFDLPSYEKNNKKIDFILKNESSITSKIPMYDEDLYFESESEDKKILDKFKTKIKKIGRNKFTKEQEFVVEHIKTLKEISEIDINFIEQEITPHNILVEKKEDILDENNISVSKVELSESNLEDEKEYLDFFNEDKDDFFDKKNSIDIDFSSEFNEDFSVNPDVDSKEKKDEEDTLFNSENFLEEKLNDTEDLFNINNRLEELEENNNNNTNIEYEGYIMSDEEFESLYSIKDDIKNE